MPPRRLSPLEHLLMDFVWAHPDCTVSQCRDALSASARPLKESTVRTLLLRLENKGYVHHTTDGRTYLYRAAEPRKNVAAEAVKQIIDRLCNGSLEELLVGMVDNDMVDREELADLARRIARVKKEKK